MPCAGARLRAVDPECFTQDPKRPVRTALRRGARDRSGDASREEACHRPPRKGCPMTGARQGLCHAVDRRLGNPGSRYANNRHNIGFLAVDAIARQHRASPFRHRFQGEAAEVVLGTERAILLKPSTFMNESGRSVSEAQRFYKIPLGDVIVLHDELDLAPAKLRVKLGGGNAGHNGLRSITAQCGNEYRRCGSASAIPATRRWCIPTSSTISARPSCPGSRISATRSPTMGAAGGGRGCELPEQGPPRHGRPGLGRGEDARREKLTRKHGNTI